MNKIIFAITAVILVILMPVSFAASLVDVNDINDRATIQEREEPAANIIVYASSYEPNVLTNAALEDKETPVFINLKGIAIDPTISAPEIKGRPGVNIKVITKPERTGFSRYVKWNYLPPRRASLDDLGVIQLWVGPLPSEHAPAEDTTNFNELPEEKQKIVLERAKITNETSENEKERILAEQTRKLIIEDKDNDWVKDLPRKSSFIDEIILNITVTMQFDVTTGFGIGEEQLVLSETEEKSFWRGQGKIAASEIKDDEAEFMVYSGDSRAIRDRVRLKEGMSSDTLSLRKGFTYFNKLDRFKIKLEDIRSKTDSADLDLYINGELRTVNVREGDRLYDGSNWYVKTISKIYSGYGVLEEVVIKSNDKNQKGEEETVKRSFGNIEVSEVETEVSGISQTILSRLSNYNNIIKEAAKKYNVEENLIKAVIIQESGGNKNAISQAGAAGLMQLMPSTARDSGLVVPNNLVEIEKKIYNKYGTGVKDWDELVQATKVSVNDERFNAEKNINAGVKHLSNLLKEFDGDITLALAAYNSNVADVKRYNGIPPYEETEKYVPAVLTNLNLLGGVTTKIVSPKEKINIRDIYGNTIAAYEKVIDEYPDAVDGPNSNTKVAAKALFELGKLYEKEHYISEAADVYTKLINNYPEDATVNGITQEFIDNLIENAKYTYESATIEDGNKLVDVSIKNVEPVKEENKPYAEIQVGEGGKDNKIIFGNTKKLYIGQSLGIKEGDKEVDLDFDWKIHEINDNGISVVREFTNAMGYKQVSNPVTINKGGDGKELQISSKGEKRNVRVANTLIKREAKVKIYPDYNFVRSESSFTVHLPVEKRFIQLTPAQIKKEINKTEELINKLDNIINRFETIMKWWKAACFATGLVLTVKNSLLQGADRIEAREIVTKGWKDKCSKEDDYRGCLDTNAKNITNEIGLAEKAISQYKGENKVLTKIEGLRWEDEKDKIKILDEVKASELDKENNGLISEMIRKGELKRNNLEQLLFNYYYKKEGGDVNEYNKQIEDLSKRSKELIDNEKVLDGILRNSGVTVDDPALKSTLLRNIGLKAESAYVVPYNDKFLTIVDGEAKLVDKVRVTKDGRVVYRAENGKEIISIDSPGAVAIKKFVIKTDNANKVKYAPYLDKPGYYLEVLDYEELHPDIPLDVRLWYAGEDGIMLEGNDDEMRVSSYIDGYADVDESKEDFNNIRNVAMKMNSELRKSGERATSVTVNGVGYATGKINVVESSCEDFMDANDCQIMFKVCDPVICPSSRFDLGGKWKVDNVVQSGIIGSLVLGLPRKTVCLSGVLAGLKNIRSILQSYSECLQVSYAQDKSVGICDKIRSVYLCELIWKSSVMLFGRPKAFIDVIESVGRIFDKNKGGEYSGFRQQYDNFLNTFDYFTKNYAQSSFAAFRTRNFEDVGTEICRRAIFATVPGGTDLLDNLLKPESPPQFTAWYDEYTWSEDKKLSRYSVYYHIYAGEDTKYIGGTGLENYIQYRVFLRDPELGTWPVTDKPVLRRLAVSDFADENIDVVAPSGYSEICVEINGREWCNFGKVTSDAGINWAADQYTSYEATKKINSADECVSSYGSGKYSESYYGYGAMYQGYRGYYGIGYNEKIGTAGDVEDLAKLGLTSNGIIRRCSVNALDPAEWKVVGTCGTDENTGGSLGDCYVNLKSIGESISVDYLEENALGNVEKKAEEYYRQALGDKAIESDASWKAVDEIKKSIEVDVDAMTEEDLRGKISELNNIIEYSIDNDARGTAQYLIGKAWQIIEMQEWQLKEAEQRELQKESKKEVVEEEIPVEWKLLVAEKSSEPYIWSIKELREKDVFTLDGTPLKVEVKKIIKSTESTITAPYSPTVPVGKFGSEAKVMFDIYELSQKGEYEKIDCTTGIGGFVKDAINLVTKFSTGFTVTKGEWADCGKRISVKVANSYSSSGINYVDVDVKYIGEYQNCYADICEIYNLDKNKFIYADWTDIGVEYLGKSLDGYRFWIYKGGSKVDCVLGSSEDVNVPYYQKIEVPFTFPLGKENLEYKNCLDLIGIKIVSADNNVAYWFNVKFLEKKEEELPKCSELKEEECKKRNDCQWSKTKLVYYHPTSSIYDWECSEKAEEVKKEVKKEEAGQTVLQEGKKWDIFDFKEGDSLTLKGTDINIQFEDIDTFIGGRNYIFRVYNGTIKYSNQIECYSGDLAQSKAYGYSLVVKGSEGVGSCNKFLTIIVQDYYKTNKVNLRVELNEDKVNVENVEEELDVV